MSTPAKTRGHSRRLAGGWRYIAVLAVAAAWAGWSSAAESPIDYSELSLAELMEVDVVYGASKFEQKVVDAPASVTILTAADIEAFGYQTLGDVLGSLRGFYTTWDHNYIYTGVRGFGRPGDYNSRLLVMIDGNRVNENIYDSTGMAEGSPLDLAMIDRIEVIRGPSSSLYGTSAIFGIVNVITRRGGQVDGLEAEATAGSFGRYQGRLAWGGGSEGNAEWLISASTGTIEGQDRTYAEFADTPSGGTFIAGDRADWHRLLGRLSRGRFHAETVFCWSRKHIPTAPWDVVFNDDRTWTRDDQGFVGIWYDGPLARQTSLLSRLTYSFYEYRGSWPYDYAEEGEDPWIVVNRDDAMGRWLNFENQVTRTFAGDHKVTAGVEWRRNLRQDQAVWGAEPDYWSYLADQRSSTNLGAYVLGEYRVSNRVLVNLGVRHDDYPTFGGTTNPRIAVVTRPASGSVLKAMYGSAFRAPNVFELYYNDDGVTNKGNEDLEPETIRTYELVWDQALGKNVRGLISLFYYENSDLIEQVEDPEDGLFVYANLSEMRGRGFEAELEGRHGTWRHRTSYSFQDAEYADGTNLSNSPQHLLKVHLVAPITRGTAAGLEILHSSKRQTLLGNHAAAYTLINLTINQEWPATHLNLQGGVYNLFDQEYGHPGGLEHRQDILMQDGRNFRLGISIER